MPLNRTPLILWILSMVRMPVRKGYIKVIGCTCCGFLPAFMSLSWFFRGEGVALRQKDLVNLIKVIKTRQEQQAVDTTQDSRFSASRYLLFTVWKRELQSPEAVLCLLEMANAKHFGAGCYELCNEVICPLIKYLWISTVVDIVLHAQLWMHTSFCT